MTDASFKDGRERPVKLLAQDSDDLGVISALCQDAIAERKEMLFEKEKASFSLLLKRFRWEDAEEAKRLDRPFERVQSVLMIRSAKAVRVQGFDMTDKDLAFDLIGVRFENEQIIIAFAGDGELAIEVECIDVVLSDVSRPYTAKSKQLPTHDDEV